jgi:hypothetical protein
LIGILFLIENKSLNFLLRQIKINASIQPLEIWVNKLFTNKYNIKVEELYNYIIIYNIQHIILNYILIAKINTILKLISKNI